MNTSPSIANICAALVAAQAEFPKFPRDRKVKVRMKSGGEYEFSYAPLDSILEKVRPVLQKNGIWFVQFTEGHHLLTRLIHTSGEWMESGQMPLIAGSGSVQDFGSAITYAKRYSLSAMLGIASEDDDDANLAAGNKAARPKAGKDFESLAPERQEVLRRHIADVTALIDEGRVEDAVKVLETITDDTEKVGAWFLLDSKQRSTIKTYQENMRKRAKNGASEAAGN